MSASNYLENKLVDRIFRGQALPTWGTLYVALLTSAPSDAGMGTEVSGTGYARKGVLSNLANWAGTQGAGTTTASSGTSGTTSNNAAIDFGTAGSNWGLVTHWAVCDASDGGNMLVYDAFSTTKDVVTGNRVVFVKGALQIAVD